MAHNSESFYKAKNLFNNFFSITEVGVANAAMKIRLHRQLNRFIKEGNDHISPQYKKKVEDYWKKYAKINTKYHQWYSSRNGLEDVRYIPDDLYYTKIDQYFNNRKFGWGVNDKNYYNLYFPDIKQPVTVARKINGIYYNSNYEMITKKQTIELCEQAGKIIVKPATETGGSRGIRFWNKNQSNYMLQKIFGERQNFIVQELIVQHKTLAEIHPESVNTLRVMSLIINNKVNIISTVLRMGVDGSKVDNASAGGITCGVKEDGNLKDVAYSASGIKFEKHPQGYEFSNCVIPNYEKVKQLVVKCHEKMGHFRLVSWDIAIGEDGNPILIEANLRNGECDFHQFNNGPLFGDLTELVLSEIFERK